MNRYASFGTLSVAAANRRVRETGSDLGRRVVKAGILEYLPLETRPTR